MLYPTCHKSARFLLRFTSSLTVVKYPLCLFFSLGIYRYDTVLESSNNLYKLLLIFLLFIFSRASHLRLISLSPIHDKCGDYSLHFFFLRRSTEIVLPPKNSFCLCVVNFTHNISFSRVNPMSRAALIDRAYS